MRGHPGDGHPGANPKHAGFQRSYETGSAPWDIGRPQPAMVELETAGEIGHRVLEIGCGRGALSLYLAEHGHDVVGIDVAPAAIEAASASAQEQGLPVRFVVADALRALDPDFPDIGPAFDTVVDVGFFHSLSDDERPRLLVALRRLLPPGGVYRFLCFSDEVPGQWGPRRISEREIRDTFAGPDWNVFDLSGSRLETNVEQMREIPAWLVGVERVAD